ncbi:hypothetical protein GOBAR_AA13400 [Gossypium barbadense]|uniref:Uncharacterized protein n=1 Tax=Gossypium barbadense TaxID=3634 RepID=A0A2P5XV96_GOSBA|nr:hypothetical protein GOBAR_AA13400 [Gossypium barbadense]
MSKKPMITKFSIQRNKKLRKSGIPTILVDAVEKEKVEDEVLLAKKNQVFLTLNCLNIYMALRKKGLIKEQNIKDASGLMGTVAFFKPYVRELVLEFYANLLSSITDSRRKLFQKSQQNRQLERMLIKRNKQTMKQQLLQGRQKCALPLALQAMIKDSIEG